MLGDAMRRLCLLPLLAFPLCGAISEPSSRHDMWVHVALRTHAAQSVQVIGTVGSLFGAAQHAGSWLKLTLAVLNTGQGGEQGHAQMTAVIDELQKLVDPLKGVRKHPALVLRPNLNEGIETYGYMSSDAELGRVVRMKQPPDYIMFCNGGSLYAQEVFSEARQWLLQRTSIVGINWFPTAPRQNAGVQPPKACNFQHASVDLNGLMVRELDSFLNRAPCRRPIYALSPVIHHL